MEKFIMAGDCAIRINESDRIAAAGNSVQADPPVIVLLHGYLESADVWDDFAKLLTAEMKVVTMDLPGHGISEVKGEIHTMEFLADTVKAALDRIGVEKCFLAGHSMGGYAGLEFLRKYPEMLHGFILFHSSPYPDTEEKKQQRMREIDIIDSGKKDLLANTVENGFAPENRERLADAVEDFKERVVLTEEAGIKALLRGMKERADSNNVLKESSVPEMFIFGRKDEYIKEEEANNIISGHPQAEVVWLENSGHTGFVEEPEKAAGAILNFCLKHFK